MDFGLENNEEFFDILINKYVDGLDCINFLLKSGFKLNYYKIDEFFEDYKTLFSDKINNRQRSLNIIFNEDIDKDIYIYDEDYFKDRKRVDIFFFRVDKISLSFSLYSRYLLV